MSSDHSSVSASLLRDEIALSIMEAHGMDFEAASRYAEPAVRYLQQEYGGRLLYVPLPMRVVRARDLRAARAKGMLVKEICRHYGITDSTYYRILARGADTPSA